MRKGYCITSEDTGDNFVGIRIRNNEPEVVFPRGYNIPDNEAERRKDIFRLIGVLQRFTPKKEGGKPRGSTEVTAERPLTSYMYVIHDYLMHGYYIEKENDYIHAPKGKINWKRTIQHESACVSRKNAVYLNFQVLHSRYNENNLITHIHRYCVYESFRLFGWLYLSSNYRPKKPAIKFDKSLFTIVLRKALLKTNNDEKKKLFASMLNIVNDSREDINYRNSAIGVNHFAGVWERLINYVFGEDNIEHYFPHAQWHILENGKFVTSTALEPDTIMKFRDSIYILDAKYYQYGVTWASGDLPNTSSIQKQITYGKHVQTMNEVEPENIYNAFIMPYNCANTTEQEGYILKFVAVGSAGWEEYKKKDDLHNYSYILGILLDTRHILTSFSRHNLIEIERLADVIEKSIKEYKAAFEDQESIT